MACSGQHIGGYRPMACIAVVSVIYFSHSTAISMSLQARRNARGQKKVEIGKEDFIELHSISPIAKTTNPFNPIATHEEIIIIT